MHLPGCGIAVEKLTPWRKEWSDSALGLAGMLLLVLPLFGLVSEAPRNEVSAHLTFPFPRWGAAVGYQRALGRHVSLSAQLEMVVPARGYLHLPGFEELLGAGFWLRRVGQGPYLSPTVSFAHNVFYRLPDQARHAFRLGGEAGWRLVLTRRLSVGVGLSGQWGWDAGHPGSICTYDYQCASSRAGGVIKGRVSIGVRW